MFDCCSLDEDPDRLLHQLLYYFESYTDLANDNPVCRRIHYNDGESCHIAEKFHCRFYHLFVISCVYIHQDRSVV